MGLWTGSGEVSQARRSGGAGALGGVRRRVLGTAFHSLARGGVVGDARGCAPPGMQHGGVVAPAELPPDGGQRLACELAGEVHGELSRPGDTRGARGGEELLAERSKCSQAAAWISATVRGVAAAARAWVEAVEDLARELAGERPAGERAEGDDADQRALERAHVACDALGDHLERVVVGELDVVVVGALAQDRQAGGERRAARCRRRGRPRSARAGGPRAPAGRCGGRSEVSTIWRPPSWRALKVWKNSSSVRVLRSRNWTSSSSSTSTSRKRALKSSVLPPPSAARNSLVKASPVVQRTVRPGLWVSSRFAIELSRWVLPTRAGRR